MAQYIAAIALLCLARTAAGLEFRFQQQNSISIDLNRLISHTTPWNEKCLSPPDPLEIHKKSMVLISKTP